MYRLGMIRLSLLTILGTLCLISTIIGCIDAGTDVVYSDPEGVRAQAGSSSLLITNKTGKVISVFIVEQQAVAFIDWIPLCDEENAIDQGSAVEITYSGITGYSRGASVLVYWWTCTPTYDGHLRILKVKTL